MGIKRNDVANRKAIRQVAYLMTIVAAVAGAQPAPDSAERAGILEAVRQAALAYDQKLPNFFCTQATTREIAKPPEPPLDPRYSRTLAGLEGAFQLADSFEQQLAYYQHRESYKLIKINGRTPGRVEKVPPGATSTGEFGSTLRNLFDPASNAEFRWSRWDTIRGRRVVSFAFEVAQSNSQYELVTPVVRAVVGYHGRVFADRDTNAVLRVITEADSPPDFPLQDAKHTLEYGYFSISGERFVLPMRDELQVRTSDDFFRSGTFDGSSHKFLLMRNRNEFRNYQRYTADTELKFDPVDK